MSDKRVGTSSMRPPRATRPAAAQKTEVEPSSRQLARSTFSTDVRPPSAASTSTAVSTQQNYADTAPPPSPSKRTKGQGTNIKVVVRCRGPSTIEMRDRTPIIVATDGPRSEEVIIADPLVRPNIHSTSPKVYQFDQVFGPDADQSLIYQDVVVPILNDVFDGYNCTIFAYGQTGTGKTYTMHGELEAQLPSGLSADAGIVPRVITRLFQRLERDYADYAVSISCMEIYNEELRDLLASQPLNGVTPRNLKIFEHPQSRGTLVQGLLEIPVKDVKTAIEVLRRGSAHRHVASTNFNKNSSRSHSLFTVSVTAASSSTDMFQIGKLNLVDLAGSEDIGRSGAENVQAKEAGLINKSLLTLGRVINALVEKSEKPNTHIPYRESLLTRILQDSLGGNTKTCIIATISPVKANQDETISTLEYAIRARNIKNNPELTRRVAKHMLLKDMVSEIDKLRSELTATREMNGRYCSEEQWAEMEEEREQLRKEHAEAKRAREITDARLATLREEHSFNLFRLQKGEAELAETKNELQRVNEILSHTGLELASVKQAVEEEVIVRRAYEASEANLDHKANGLKHIAREGIAHVEGLISKIDRKSRVFSSNIEQVKGHERELAKSLQNFDAFINHHHSEIQTFLHTHLATAEDFKASQLQILNHDLELLDQQLATLDAATSKLSQKEEAASELANVLLDHVQSTASNIMDTFVDWKTTLVASHSSYVEQLQEAIKNQSEGTVKSIQSMGAIHDTLAREVKDYMESQQHTIATLQSTVEITSTAEVKRLRTQNESLTKLVASEKATSDAMVRDIIANVTKSVMAHSKQRDEQMQSMAAKLSVGLVEGQREMEALNLAHKGGVDGMLAAAKDLSARADKRTVNGKKARESATSRLNGLTLGATDNLEKMRSLVDTTTAGHEDVVAKQATGLVDSARGGFARLENGGLGRRTVVEGLRATFSEAQSEMHNALSMAIDGLHTTVAEIVSSTSSTTQSIQSFHATAGKQISKLERTSHSLGKLATAVDVPTGTTPKKRKWSMSEFEEWEVVQSRAEAIRRYREEAVVPKVDVVCSELTRHIDGPDGDKGLKGPETPMEDLTPKSDRDYVDYEVPLAGSEDGPEAEMDKQAVDSEAEVPRAAVVEPLQPAIAPRSRAVSTSSHSTISHLYTVDTPSSMGLGAPPPRRSKPNPGTTKSGLPTITGRPQPGPVVRSASGTGGPRRLASMTGTLVNVPSVSRTLTEKIPNPAARRRGKGTS